MKDWLSQCVACIKRKSPVGRHHPLGNIPTGHRWDRIAMDILDVCDPTPEGFRYILVIADYFSKWTEAFPMKNKCADTVADILVENIILRFGMPLVIHSDQGREFENGLMKSLCVSGTGTACTKTRTAPYNKTVRELTDTNIRAACDDLRRQCHSQGVAFGDLSRLVNQAREDQEETRAYSHGETGPHPRIRQDLLDAGGNLQARDIGISWRDGETFLHGVRITGQKDDREDNRPRPATAAPYPPCLEEMEDARRQPVMSTPYHHEHPPSGMSTPGFPRPVCIEMSDTPTHHFAGPRQEGRPAHRPAAPIQRFNSKSIGWPAWFRHFRAVADVQGWDKDQRALQMVSYLDEKAMNVAQELSDRELYNYDALVGLLSARFDPASRVSASRSRFHGRTRRHQEDADTYADSITELCRLGYPQSSPELRQELISEQFVRGQSDPELKKYLWVVIRTQKDKKLQTLIEVCTDFASLSHTTSVHRPAEQVFALEEEDDREEEMFAVVDRQQWSTQRAAEPPLSPELQQMFALARRMGYEMRPIARRFDAPRQAPGPRSSPNKDYRAPFRPRDYSRTKCFSCGQLGHTQVRCPKPDSSLPFRPSGWVDRSDGPQRNSGGPPQGNEI